MSQLLRQTIDAYGYSFRTKTQHGPEHHIACPSCGSSAKKGRNHFSYGAGGGYCFVCGQGMTLVHMLKMKGRETAVSRPEPVPIKETPTLPKPSWFHKSAMWYSARYETDYAIQTWREYKSLSSDLVKRARLGYGRVPNVACSHNRLIVPIFDEIGLVNLRGRALGCGCDKWLGAGADRDQVFRPISSGWKLVDIPAPYNWQAVENADYHLQAVWLMENPVDALLFTAKYEPHFVGVATLSTSYWRDEWRDLLLEHCQRVPVIVAYDNDLPGNGGAVYRNRAIRQWQKKHKTDRIPKAKGIDLTNKLLEAGMNAHLFDWGVRPLGTDIGDML